MPPLNNRDLLLRYRVSLGVFIFGLILSGLAALALEPETALLNRLFGLTASVDPASFFFKLRVFITTLHYAVHDTYLRFPFFGYNTDWLGFSHLVIAACFVLPLVDPVRYRAILHIGLLACAGVIVVGMISGLIRSSPLFWTLIDCSFGIIGAILLLYCLHLTRIDS